jgi:hypothetical protein
MIDKEALAAMPLEELRELQRLAEQQVFDRRCHSQLNGVGPCMLEPPHADGWHECSRTFGNHASPGYSAAPEPVTVRWRFADEVVDQEHAHEARRRPGAN